MRVRSTIMLSATTIALLASGQVIAQTGAPPKQGADPKTRPEDLQGRSRRVSKLLDCTVKNSRDEKIGSIKDVVIDKDEGVVAYAVLSFGGFLSVGEKLFLIPLASINRTDDEEVVILNVAKEQLEKAPNFAADTWPTIDSKYGTMVHEYYKATPYWTAKYRVEKGDDPARVGKDALDKESLRVRGMCRASKVIGTNVQDPSAKDIGEIEDIVIDDANGRIVYGVLSFGGFLGMGDKLFAIPWQALKPSGKDGDKFVLDVPKAKLEKAPGFDKKNWPSMADRRWGLDVDKYWDAKTEKSGAP